MAVPHSIRHRLEAQGFCNLDDAAMTELAPWLRWSPALCTTVIAIGLVLRAPLVLWGLAAIALLGAALPFHPFDLVDNHFVRRFTGTASLPHHAAQRRFACALATVWLAATGLALYVGATVLGLVLGVALVCVAALVSITHICIPSMIYNALFASRSALAPKRPA